MRDILVLSDIHGNYFKIKDYFYSKNTRVHFLSSLELAKINYEKLKIDGIHESFINGGIDLAVEKLNHLKIKKYDYAIGCSIGGVILWKSALQELKIENMICLSATRLRFEHTKPNTNIHLYYGDNDKFKPSQEWFEKLKIEPHLIKDIGHDFYSYSEIVIPILNKIII